MPFLTGKAVVQVCAVLLAALAVHVYRNPILLVQAVERLNLYFRTPFTVKTLQLSDNFTMEYMERGDVHDQSPSLLLVHGFKVSKFGWHRLEPHLPEDWHLIAVDLPGHGGSTAPKHKGQFLKTSLARLKEFVIQLGLDVKRFHLAGASMGGHLSGIYSATHPNDILSLTLMAPGGIKSLVVSEIEALYIKTGKIVMLPETVEEFYDSFPLIANTKIEIPTILARGMVQQSIRARPFLLQVIAEFLDDDVRFSLEKCLSQVKAPVLVVWGADDKILHVSATEVIKKKLPDSKVLIFNDCGHAIDIDKPKELAEAMVVFLRQTEASMISQGGT